VFDIHQGLDLLYTALGWLSNIALVTYAPFAKSWRRALLVQCVLLGAWAAARFIATSHSSQHIGLEFYLVVIVETLVFAVVTRTLKLLLFKLPALKALEAQLRRSWGEQAS